jgi:hypothetical protein
MTTEERILLIFGAVEDGLGVVPSERKAKRDPSEGMTIAIRFGWKRGRCRAFDRWRKRDGDGWFGGRPDRTALQRPLRRQEARADPWWALPSWLKGMDRFPIEGLFPMRAGRSAQPIGTQNRDQGRGSIGLKWGWMLNRLGRVVGWHGLPMNHRDPALLPLVDGLAGDGLALADLGFGCQPGVPHQLKGCLKGTWNDRRLIETSFSWLTVVGHTQHRLHRTAQHLHARLADTAALFNLLIGLDRQLHPDDPFRTRIAAFSL